MTAPATYWRTPRRPRRIAGARRGYWFALAFAVGYHMLFTPFTVVTPW